MWSFNVNDLRRLIREALGNAYRVLGVDPKASPDEIKAAFRRKMLANHPDRGGSTEVMAQLNVANTILSDPEKRKKYDMYGDRTIDAEPQAAKAAPPPPRPAPAPKPYNPPSPRNNPSPGASSSQSGAGHQPSDYVKRSFVFNDLNRGGKSNKFWNVSYPTRGQMVGPNVVFTVAIRWGRVGSLGSRQVKTFYSSSSMLSWIEKMVWSKKEKGYVEQQRAGAGAPKGSQQSAPPPKAKRPRREPTGKARASKKTYKIYGSKRGKPIHTRVGGRVYIPTGQSKFSKGDNPEVVVGSDGRASVIDPQTGHTQHWDGFDEVKTWVNDLVIEALVTKFNSVLSS